MKRLFAALALSGALLPGLANAHPTTIPFDSFGECNAALNQQNKDDRERVGAFFPSNGAAQVNMLNNWTCEYDPDLDLWFFAGQPSGGSNLGNGNGKANPGSN